MSIIVPTVLARNRESYDQGMDSIKGFTSRVHIDLMEEDFAGVSSIAPDQVWWPEGLEADIHAMYGNPAEYLDSLIALRPNTIVLHAEAQGNIRAMLSAIGAAGIRPGIALLPDTQVPDVEYLLDKALHVLVFGGHLGHDGGVADLTQLAKANQLRQQHPNVEIGWDGGANADNVSQLAEAGIDVIFAGSAIRGADDPQKAYEYLSSLL